jgi:hypothetical protein
MALGNMPQAKANGRQIMGGRLPFPSRRGTRGKAGSGRFSEWIVDRGAFEIAVGLGRVHGAKSLERELLERDIA